MGGTDSTAMRPGGLFSGAASPTSPLTANVLLGLSLAPLRKQGVHPTLIATRPIARGFPCPLHPRSRRPRQHSLCARYSRGSRAPSWAVGGFGSLGGWTRPQSPQGCSPVTRVRVQQGAEARRKWGIRQPRRLDPSARYVAQMISLPGGQLSACGSAPKRLH